MKTKVRIFGASILIAIYCLAVGAVMHTTVDLDHVSDDSTNLVQNHPVVSNNFFNHISFFESTVDSLNNIPPPNFESPFDKLWATTKATEHLFKAVFKQYDNFIRSCPIQLGATDIIFPFHYFW